MSLDWYGSSSEETVGPEETGGREAVLVLDDPDDKEAHGSLLPDVDQFGLVIFQQEEVDHLAEILQVAGDMPADDVLHHLLHG